MAQGEAGFVNAEISITTGGTYSGGGYTDYVGGTTYSFSTRVRQGEFDRPRQNTTDSAYKQGVGGPVSEKINMEIYYKGANYPPTTIALEYVLVQITAGKTITGVVLVERFACIGEIDSAVHYTFQGETDSAFLIEDAIS